MRMPRYAGFRTTDPDALAEVLTAMDPDWRGHFRDADHAAQHYRRYAPDQWIGALNETGYNDDDV